MVVSVGSHFIGFVCGEDKMAGRTDGGHWLKGRVTGLGGFGMDQTN